MMIVRRDSRGRYRKHRTYPAIIGCFVGVLIGYLIGEILGGVIGGAIGFALGDLIWG